MPPTPECTTLTLTSSFDRRASACASASCEPCTSALISRASVFLPLSPSPICSNMFSSLVACCLASFTSRNLPWRNSAISRALRSSASATTSSPARGTSDRPWISTGIDGPALCTGLPFSSSIARTRPYTAPASTTSPRLSVPDCTSSVATGPRPLSRRASITTPLAGALTGAFSSSTSACSRICSSSASMPCAGLGRDRHHGRLAAEVFRHHPVREQVLLAPSPDSLRACRSC